MLLHPYIIEKEGYNKSQLIIISHVTMDISVTELFQDSN